MALQCTQQLLQFAIALGDLSGIGIDQRQGLFEGKQVLVAPVALQRCGDLGLISFDATVAQLGQCGGITLAGDAAMT